jgi:hypothetical protein
MDPRAELSRDMVKAFEDLPPGAFSERRSAAAELGVPVETLCLVVYRGYLPERKRQRKSPPQMGE